MESVYNHVVLPPRLPSRQDIHLRDTEHDLMKRLVRSCRILRDKFEGEHYALWDTIRRSLETASRVNANQKIDKASLVSALAESRPKETLILHVGQQNAGILITKQQR